MIKFNGSDPRYPIEIKLIKSLLIEILNTINEREKGAILLYYFEGETNKSGGKIFDRSYETFRRLRTRGVRKLKHPDRKRLLEEAIR